MKPEQKQSEEIIMEKVKNWIYFFCFVILIVFMPFTLLSQNFTSYYTGNTNDVITNPSGGICLMGGASEDDNAMTWFLQKANGGDVLVLRTSGSDGYNNYLYTSLGANVNSVETIVCHNFEASSDPYILQKIQQAEAIWFAGGDQWTYISYWRNTPVDSLINQSIRTRNIAVGGTSAGMAIQGKYYFSAQNGTVTSATALANPFNNLVTVDSISFIQNNILSNVITDTHFDNPDRKGRISTFLARIATDYGIFGKAIACDEYTAVCIDTNGVASVYGDYPSYAYFIQTNCELSSQMPENCTNGNSLTWNQGGAAIKVYRILSNASGPRTFNLNNWATGFGGEWLNWSVSNGVFSEQAGDSIDCTPLSVNIFDLSLGSIFPNPTAGKMRISFSEQKTNPEIAIYNVLGNRCVGRLSKLSENEFEIDLSCFSDGIYFLSVIDKNERLMFQKVIVSH